MKLSDIVKGLNLSVKAGRTLPDREVTGGYAGDMLSDVLAHSRKGDIWVTLQVHLNIIPVASMKELAGIIIVNDRSPDEETLRKAEEENIPVMGTRMNTFQVVTGLYKLGISG